MAGLTSGPTAGPPGGPDDERTSGPAADLMTTPAAHVTNRPAADLTTGPATHVTSRPGDGGHAPPDEPVHPRAVRVAVAPGLGIDLGPWTVSPDSPRPRSTEPVHVVPGSVDPPARDGVRRREVVAGGWRFLLDVEPERSARLRERARRGREDAAHGGPLEVRAIIPGRIVAVSVAEGDMVETGQQLLVIEAMKMQNELRSPRGGRVERVAVGAGQTVELGTLLLVVR